MRMVAEGRAEAGFRLKRWSLEEYRRFVEVGAIGPEDRVEFVEGEIVEKMGQKLPHITGAGALADALREVYGRGFHVREARPIVIERSEPEPDLSVLEGRALDYADRHPAPHEIALLVEISDTTLPYDRDRKAALYARGRIAEYWIVDLNARRLVVHRGPLPDGSWEEVRTHPETARVAPLSAEGEIVVAEILPPPDAE